ncbi:MAG: hypothetical protein WKG06_12420 [Segetibacter sp.]
MPNLQFRSRQRADYYYPIPLPANNIYFRFLDHCLYMELVRIGLFQLYPNSILHSSISADKDTFISYAVCFTFLTSDTSCQLKRGTVTSRPIGLEQFSVSRLTTLTWAKETTAGKAAIKKRKIFSMLARFKKRSCIC